jgi:hypothetical protein
VVETGQSSYKLIPAPVGGLNARDPLHAMAENDAVSIINLFPDTSSVVTRGGYKLWLGSAAGGARIIDVFAFNKIAQSSSSLIVVDFNNPTYSIKRIDVATKAVATVTGTAVVGAPVRMKYCTVQFNGKLIACDTSGSQAPWDIGETGNAAATAWSGSGLTLSNLCYVDAYKGRLYFAEKGTQNIWYGSTLGVTGTLTKYDASLAFRMGGSIVAVGSTSQNSQEVQQNLFVAISSVGELAVFSGDFPGSSNWTLVSRYFVGEPTPVICTFYRGNELHIITVEGIFPIGSVLSDTKNGTKYVAISDKIEDLFYQLVGTTLGYANGMRFNVAVCPNQKSLMVTGHRVGFAAQFNYVQNLITGSWTTYTSSSAAVMKHLYVDNKTLALASLDVYTPNDFIFELKSPGSEDNADENTSGVAQSLGFSCRQAFNFLDDPRFNKNILSSKYFLTLSQGFGHDQTIRTLTGSVATDFSAAASSSSAISLPDAALVTTGYYMATPTDTRAEGLTFSVIINGQLGEGYSLAWNLTLLDYELGGFT